MNNDSEKEEGAACSCGGGSCGSGSGKWIWIVLVLAVAGVLVAKNAGKKPAAALPAVDEPSAAVEASAAQTTASDPAAQSKALPRLVDLGASSCIPCKAMKPILDDLMANYAEVFKTEFIDVWENPGVGQQYGVRAIPTQIFYDTAGKELFRHEGFFGKDDILAKWKDLGVGL